MSDVFETTEYVINGNYHSAGPRPTPTPSGENPLFIDSNGYISIDYDKVEDRRE